MPQKQVMDEFDDWYKEKTRVQLFTYSRGAFACACIPPILLLLTQTPAAALAHRLLLTVGLFFIFISFVLAIVGIASDSKKNFAYIALLMILTCGFLTWYVSQNVIFVESGICDLEKNCCVSNFHCTYVSDGCYTLEYASHTLGVDPFSASDKVCACRQRRCVELV
ncbi:MAG TPA: hypothetical protein VK158_01965 [Acidobacteriota bacterium]|nr:hypothetical protein [Acidobacteriota bacterium]